MTGIIKMLYRIREKIVKTAIISLRGNNAYARYAGVTVGQNCRLRITNWGSEPFLISIGNKVTIAAGSRLITHDGSLWLISDDAGRRFHYRKISIGNNVFIGMNSIILPGVKIGDNVIVGAGAIVTKSIPSGKIVGGNPAKVIGDFEAFKKKALQNLPGEKEMSTGTYKDRVLRAMDLTFKPDMK